MIHPERIRRRNERDVAMGGAYVLYWMQQSQRHLDNHALAVTIREASMRGLPVVVGFGLTSRYPSATPRHYRFMLEGLVETARHLDERGVAFVVRAGEPPEVALDLARHAVMVIMDRGYLAHQQAWREQVARAAPCLVLEVETDVVVPVEVVTDKAEYAARTIRPKLTRLMPRFLSLPDPEEPHVGAHDLALPSLPTHDVEALATALGMELPREPSVDLTGGPDQALRHMERFVTETLDEYATRRNDPTADATSRTSPYLHFGQISPLRMAAMALHHGGPGADAFVEELVVRRELAINHVVFNERYDSYQGLPRWARETLERHRDDPRDHVYAFDTWAAADTHDPYWNAAQKQLLSTGHIHGYMRMYWGKKLIEWSATPEEAYATAITLNDTYALDGRDPNGYTGVAWCFGLHDRPWKERPVLGTIRYMNANGLKRKFDADEYVRRMDRLE